MAINFNELPAEKANRIDNFEAGLYRVKVEAGDMKKNKKGEDYLNIRLGVFSEDNKRITGVFDIFKDSDHPLLQFKLRRFLEACQLNIEGVFDLKDLPKIIMNKELQAYLKVQKDDTYGDKIVVDIAPDDIYVPLDSTDTVIPDAPMPDDEDAPIPFEPDMTTEDDTEY